MSETAIERAACRQILAKFGVGSVKLTLRSTGYPDRLFWIPGGMPLLVEFKRPGERPRPKQEHVIAELRRLGYDVVICDSADCAVRAVRNAVARAAMRGKK